MEHDAQAQFERDVDGWTRDALARSVTVDFSSLVAALPGVYPSDVRASVERLVAGGDVSAAVVQRLLHANPVVGGTGYVEPACPLPIPHPLDFDWRFSIATVDLLLDRCLTLTRPADAVAFLGAPRLAIRAARTSFPRRFTCLDRNPDVIATVVQHGHPGSGLPFDAAVDAIPSPRDAGAVCIDPPWYLPQFCNFLWVASALCRAGGHVLLSVPAAGTRPGMSQEWNQMQAWADLCGLALTSYERSALAYAAPPFEQSALRAGGFRGICTQWRRSDLAVFVRNDQPSVARPSSPSSALPPWTETVIDGVAFRVRPSATPSTEIGFRDPRLRSLVSGDVLPSVSARDHRRALADVWTTHNRIFACTGRELLGLILRALANGVTIVPSLEKVLGRSLPDVERVQVLEAVQQIQKIVTIERNEQSNGFNDVEGRVAISSPG